jgi:hypothetical protein
MRYFAIVIVILIKSSAVVHPLTPRSTEQIQSIQLNGTIDDGKDTFDFNLMVKGQDKLRASIQIQGRHTKFEIIYLKGILCTSRTKDKESETVQLEGTKAATNLLDLIAMNPLHHFKSRDGFEMDNPVFKDFELVYESTEDLKESIDDALPLTIKLYEIGTNTRSLTRTIKYVSFHDVKEVIAQPKEILLIDETSANTARIIINDYSYNKGIPDFVFN